MFDRSQPLEFGATSATVRQSVMGHAMSLLGVAFLCTAGGALIGIQIGPAAFVLSIVGTIGTLIALLVAREKSPANLWLMYAFATFEGMALGLILQSYVQLGMGSVVLDAAATTGAVALAAGSYGAGTKRDLSSLGSILFIGLIAVVVASFIGIFVHMPLLYLGVSLAAAVLFTGFLVYDLNRIANAKSATEGQTIMLALGVYLDILNLFLALLRIFAAFSGGGSSRD